MATQDNLDPKLELVKKKKSAFRITSIIDPVKNDDDDDDKINIAEGKDDYSVSRFRVIKSQTPNPRTYKAGRWKVKEMYMAEMNHKDAELKSGTSASSLESTGENIRSTLHSMDSPSGEDPSLFVSNVPKRNSAHFDSVESQFQEMMKSCRRQYEDLYEHSSTLGSKFEELKKAFLELKVENVLLKEEIKRLKSPST